MSIGYRRFDHLHVLVDDLDAASTFYREVMGFIEMQSHEGLVNRGLATYYGRGDRPESLEVSLRFLLLPEVTTLKLVKIKDMDYRGVSSPPGGYPSQFRGYQLGGGAGPVSIVVDDLDAAYVELLRAARDYSSRFRIQLLSPPTYLSPLLPHQTGTTKYSALRGEHEVIAQLADVFPSRAKFMMIDPFAVHWEFNNDVL